MIRAIIFAALGFWISRELYERYDRKKRKEELTAIQHRLRYWLEKEKSYSPEEIEIIIDQIIDNHVDHP